MVELGASTMLPSLAVAARHPHCTCFATDVKKVMALTEQCYQLNDQPANVVPLELCWGDSGHYERLSSHLAGSKVDYVVCADLIYDEELFDILIETLTFLSQVNQDSVDNGDNRYPLIFISLKIRDPELTQNFLQKFTMAF